MVVHVGTKTCKFPLPVMDMPELVLRLVRILAHALTGTGICMHGCVIICILFSVLATYLPPWGWSCERSSTSMGTVHYGYWHTIIFNASTGNRPCQYWYILVQYYRWIRSVSNTQSKQSRENLTLPRTSLVGLNHIPTLVSELNSTIVFLF